MPHRVILKKSFRIKFIVTITLTVFLGIILTVIFYYFTFNINIDTGYAGKISALSQYKQKFFFNTLIVFFIFALISLIAIIIFSTVYTHKIVEPLYRIKKVAVKVSEGNFDETLHLRKDDAIHELPDTINHFINSYKIRLAEIKKVSTTMYQKSEEFVAYIEKKDNNATQREFNMVMDLTKKLNKLINDIKT